MKRLVIISHTEHYKTETGQLVGLAPTVKEINHLAQVFDHIYHIAMFHDTIAPANTLAYNSKNISFVAIPKVGGKHFKDKIGIITKIPKILKVIHKTLQQADYFQFRAPTGIGVFVIPYLLTISKSGWFKYAGNWKQSNAPRAYRFQKWLLLNQSRYVTINGQWENQSKHCLSFENPCLTDKEIQEGQNVSKSLLDYKTDLEICFVGRLEEEKGIGVVLDSIVMLNDADKAKIKTLHIVGDGEAKEMYNRKASSIGVSVIFHGLLSRDEVHDVYKKSHVIVLPSASEGFPKVISEAMNYNCIPIVSDVSSISHYIKHEYNGLLLKTLAPEELKLKIEFLLALQEDKLNYIIGNLRASINRFTYSYYNYRIINEIIT